jgi:hypothetical protein
VTGEVSVRFRQPLKIGELTTGVARVTGTRGRLVTTSAELLLDRDRTLIATASATFVKVNADVEADWRARYLRDPDTLTAELGVVPQVAAEIGAEHNRVDPQFDDAAALEGDE